jgi:hypothetical protein
MEKAGWTLGPGQVGAEVLDAREVRLGPYFGPIQGMEGLTQPASEH